ncbi:MULTISPECIES: PDGLE domain-containing protein [unclassified Nocardioides]|uniref:PDGLE domain-containing protein n=1 Tax=Nocardioides sp. URHA0032 TaxID=1380388 RepID=UPI00055BC3FD|nr:PDGLE domain-containing protein [Nocardioides sp. URHA0032]
MRTRWLVLGVLTVALVLAGVASRFADHDPDGLTKVSQDHGFAHTGQTHGAVFGGYGSVTGILGVVLVLALAGGITYAVRRRRSQDDQS